MNVTELVFEDGAFIDSYAYANHSELTSVTFGKSVTIMDHAFINCVKLNNVNLTTEIIRKGTFANCVSLKNITLNGVREIKDGAFQYSGVENISLPNTLTRIENNAFSMCSNLKNITLPDSLEMIGNNCFKCSALQSIVIPKSVKRIGNAAFMYCEDLVDVNHSFKRLPRHTFTGCPLKNNNERTLVENISEH